MRTRMGVSGREWVCVWAYGHTWDSLIILRELINQD